jgi:hypothetical protein
MLPELLITIGVHFLWHMIVPKSIREKVAGIGEGISRIGRSRHNQNQNSHNNNRGGHSRPVREQPVREVMANTMPVVQATLVPRDNTEYEVLQPITQNGVIEELRVELSPGHTRYVKWLDEEHKKKFSELRIKESDLAIFANHAIATNYQYSRRKAKGLPNDNQKFAEFSRVLEKVGVLTPGVNNSWDFTDGGKYWLHLLSGIPFPTEAATEG